jgi:hypothetical protein
VRKASVIWSTVKGAFDLGALLRVGLEDDLSGWWRKRARRYAARSI